MKRFVTLLLAFVLLLSLVACGMEATPDSNDETNSTQTETDGEDNSIQEETPEDVEETESSEITFTELVAVDNEECLIKITGIEPDNMWGYTLKAELENKSADKTYMFSVQSAAINGVCSDPFFASEVAAGKKSIEEISFSNEELDENGVGDYTDIELTFRVYDNEDWTADPVAEETIHVYPYGEEKAVKFVREAQATDNVIADNEYVTVIVTGYEEDDLWGYTVNLFLLNKSDKNIMFSVDEASVNGYMADPFFAKSVNAGKCAFGSMSWDDTTLEENGITDIEEIEFKLNAYDKDTLTDYFVEEVIVLNP